MIQLALPQRMTWNAVMMNRVLATAITVGWTGLAPAWQADDRESLPVPGTCGSRSFLLFTCRNLVADGGLLPAGRWADGVEMVMARRLCVPVDAYMLLERNGKGLMLRRVARA